MDSLCPCGFGRMGGMRIATRVRWKEGRDARDIRDASDATAGPGGCYFVSGIPDLKVAHGGTSWHYQKNQSGFIRLHPTLARQRGSIVSSRYLTCLDSYSEAPSAIAQRLR